MTKQSSRNFVLLAAAAGILLFTGLSASAGEIQHREHRQQQRIARGVQSGQLTPRETTHIERNEARINREIRHDRAANGGHLTAGEKARINRQQNRESRQIYRDKHNHRVQ